MKILVIGGGGREHAILWKLCQSKGVESLFCMPGNGGISEIAECVEMNLNDFEGIKDFAKKKGVELVIVGPEGPLANGISDYLEKHGIPVFGPSRKATLLEASKIFSKEFMRKQEIKTADFKIFHDFEHAYSYIKELLPPYVVKADGLCGGKGAYVIKSNEEGEKCIRSLMVDEIHGEAGKKIVVEDFLDGIEVSYLVFTDGENILPVIPSQDHKALLDGDRGPNTGGMGAYAPVPFVNEALEDRIKKEIMEKAVKGLKEEGVPYKGILYGGLMIKDTEAFVLEFNARFGDPETQPILFLMESDILPIITATVEGRLKEIKEIKWKKGVCVCVVLASQGYPEKPLKGMEIKGLDTLKDEQDVCVFHAGTKKIGSKYYTDGGRVLGVTARGETYKEAIEKAYWAVSHIHFDGMHFRKDIGQKALS